jgi:membrane protease YdiL (CAAX protease family)
MKDRITQYRTLLTMIALSVIWTLAAKEILIHLVWTFASSFTYLQIWSVNAAVAYAPPLLIYGYVMKKGEAALAKRGTPPVAETTSCEDNGAPRASRPTDAPAARFNYLLLPLLFVSLYFLCMSASIFSNFAADVLNRHFGTGELRDVFAQVMPLSAEQWLIMFFFVGIVAAVAEEVIFRHLLLKPLRRFGDRQAVVITALLFGAFHANLTQFLYAVIAGLLLGAVTVRANSLLPAIILHAANNLFNVGLAYMGQTSLGDAWTTVALYVFIAGFMATIGLFVQKQFSLNKGDVPARAALTHPVVIAMTAVLAFSVIRGS